MYFIIGQIIYTTLINCTTLILLYYTKIANQQNIRVFTEHLPSTARSPSKGLSPEQRGSRTQIPIKRKTEKRKSTIRFAGNEQDHEDKKTLKRSSEVVTNTYISNVLKEQKHKRMKHMKEDTRLKVESQTQIDLNSERKISEIQPLQAQKEQNHNYKKVYLIYFFTRLTLEQILVIWFSYLNLDYFVSGPLALSGGVLLRIVERFGINVVNLIAILMISAFSYFSIIYIDEVNLNETILYLIVVGIESVLSILIYIVIQKLK